MSRLGKNKVKVMSWQGQGNMKGDGQGKDKKSQGKDNLNDACTTSTATTI